MPFDGYQSSDSLDAREPVPVRQADVFALYELALRSVEATQALRGVVAAAVAGGDEPETQRAFLENYRLHLQSEGRDSDEDVVLDVLDYLTGFASPHMRI